MDYKSSAEEGRNKVDYYILFFGVWCHSRTQQQKNIVEEAPEEQQKVILRMLSWKTASSSGPLVG